jgi:Zn finger protein HypA/HybF involved in hydrogenase expression
MAFSRPKRARLALVSMVTVFDFGCTACMYEWIQPSPAGACPKCHSQQTVRTKEPRRLPYERR